VLKFSVLLLFLKFSGALKSIVMLARSWSIALKINAYSISLQMENSLVPLPNYQLALLKASTPTVGKATGN
jgi:hypothetical protein